MTNSANTRSEPNETDKTYSVTNPEFREAIFGKKHEYTLPVVVSFAGNPATVGKAAWSGDAWKPDNVALSPQENNYFSIATFRSDGSGHYRRKKKNFSALHAIMLDDVGTKVRKDRLTLPPSWVLETSPSNYQAGYILATPLTDAVTADRLGDAVIAAGLCDAGASGPTARLARLPEGANGKHDPIFLCRMREWHPDRRYTVEELVGGLQLDMRTAGRSSKSSSGRVADRPDGNDIHIPRPTENAVIVALRTRSLYKSPLGDGKHDMTCPWVPEHTGAVDGGAAYFEPDDSYPLGGFKCFHGHCANRRIRDLLKFLDVEVNHARMKPTIRIVPGEIHRIADKAEEELARTQRYYQRGGLIVTVGTDPGTRETSVREVSPPALVVALAGAATWERSDKRSGDWVRTDPPARHAGVLSDATSYNHLPVLNGLARQPYLRPDGTVMTVSGYDSTTGMFGVFNAKDFEIPEYPTRLDAENALLLLKGLLEEFSFAKETDQSAALTAILTAAIRPSLPTAPMFHARAPQISSGKSFLCQVLTAFATPRGGAPTTFPQDDEECRKVLLAEMLRAPAVIEFDNLTGDLVAHKSLCAALTAEFITGRILGVSKTVTVSTRALLLSSGNNVGPVQDMTRRCITINLDPACEVPAARTFKNPDLLPNLLRQRGLYVSAALTIIRAWIAAGRPRTACKALASYDAWSELCRQPLLWLDLPDPTASVFEAMADDPDRETLGRLLEAWQGCFGSTAKMVRDAVNHTMAPYPSASANELREVLNDIACDPKTGINRLVLGRWIKRHANRIVNGRRFVAAGGSRSASAWRVESVSSGSSGSGSAEQKISGAGSFKDSGGSATTDEIEDNALEERAAIMEYDGGMSREEAERQALQDCEDIS